MTNCTTWTRLLFCSLVTFTVLLGGCTHSDDSNSGLSAETNKPRHVILIGIDGLSTDGLLQAHTPALDALIKQGSSTLHARAVLPSSSSPNWKSMLSASGPEQHGVTSNSWERNDYILPPLVTGLEAIYPTIFGQLRLSHPNAKIAAFYTWEGVNQLIERSALDSDKHGETDAETLALATKYLVNERPEFTFIHLDNADHAGHHDGHKTAAYYHAVEVIDQQINELLKALSAANILQDSLLVIASDHGGIGYGHGGETLDEVEVPLLMSGAGIKPGYRIDSPVYTYDTGATLAYALDVPLHAAWIGRPITQAFTGSKSSGATHTPSMVSLIAPTLLPKPDLYEPAGGLFINQPATVTITNHEKNASVYYTLDGSQPNQQSLLYSAPVTINHSAVVRAVSIAKDGQSSSESVGFYRYIQPNAQNGVNYTYYEGNNWHFLPVFEQLPHKIAGQTHEFRIGDIPQRSGQFGIRFTSWLAISEPGEYTFYTYSDDGSTLSVNDQEIVNNDGDHGTLMRSGKVQLQAGRVKVTVDYFNAGGGHWLEVMYRPPGQIRQLLPPEKLFRTANEQEQAQ